MARYLYPSGSFSSRNRRLLAFIVAVAITLPLLLFAHGSAQAQEFDSRGSLPEAGKKINQLVYPTFGNPSIVPRGGEFTIEWDWRLSNASIPLWALPKSGRASDWHVYVTTSVAANVQQYDGTTNDESQWYSYRNPSDPYGYGTYEKPVHTVVNTRELKVTGVERSASAEWPEVFGRTGYVVDRISVEIPLDESVPLDLYDLHVEFKGHIPWWYPYIIPAGRRQSIRVDSQPHALQVVNEYKDDIKVLQITDTHVFGQEIQNAFALEYSSFELREPRPGTPARKLSPADRLWLKYDDFPFDKDGDGKANEGAIYLQEQLQAINLIDPDFVVFSGDAVFAQKNWNTYPKDAWPYPGTTGDVGSEYRFEYGWWYDELLALNVPVFCVPGNHDAYCWDGHQLAGGPERDDGLEIWQDLFGPAYYSWDYGDYHFLGVNTMDWPKKDTDGPEPYPIFPEFDDRNGDNYLGFITNPHKWNGQVRGGGDAWGTGEAPPGSGLRWDPGEISEYTGQLAWIRDDLTANSGKALRGLFMHHDPLRHLGEGPEMWEHPTQFGLNLPGGRGEGSQALVHLMKTYNVAFEASGHAHSDWAGKVPWYDETGEVVGLNTAAAEIPVGPEVLADKASDGYAGFRLLEFESGSLTNWGFAGAEQDPNFKWSIPAYAGIGVGTATTENPDPNGYEIYRRNRPSLQWMEQDQATPGSGGERQRLFNGTSDGVGTFTTPGLEGTVALPLDDPAIGGPFEDVTCNVNNTLDGSMGAKLDFAGCRIEFAMRELEDGLHYAVENGTVLEEYTADSGEHVVVVTFDVAGGQVLPVRVHAVND